MSPATETDEGPLIARPACPLCGSTRSTTLYESSLGAPPLSGFLAGYYSVDTSVLSDSRYRLDECEVCHLVFQRDVGRPAFLDLLYSDWMPDVTDPAAAWPSYARALRTYPLGLEAHELRSAAAALGKPITALRTLDYGMGWGLWARIAVQLGAQSHGIDIAPNLLDFARRHGVSVVTEAEIDAGGFDFINTEQVLEHLVAPGAVLTKLAAALAPGGILKVSVPSGEGARRIAAALRGGTWRGDLATIMPVQPLEHINSFNREALAHAARTRGLRIIPPGWLNDYAFLRHPHAGWLKHPKALARELARPIHRRLTPTNIHVWLRAGG